ncbi:YodC family protein [Ancylobacter pratisalsi]|uniref:DUF2158 domain-containing protein n=1 Tax=Ancylobacter pratisalsi TaxID=1745854 RepID=A0A6P1YMM3_9HYPH|nr:DUF2158 domain-containing protein [Ancylobacter pratisalsi]QIB34608.1 DUF2158 domain-containing protein [Ancylobacter pratisalsi]
MSFEPGDVVRLKSGGPAMTVEQVDILAATGKEAVWCTWFEKVGNRQMVQRDTFAPAMLIKSSEPGIGILVV